MLGRVGVLRGMLVGRAVAAQRRAALLAGAQMHPLRADLHALGALPALAVSHGGDRVEMLKKISVPSLVIHGLADPLVPVACGRDTARLIPGATLREIEGMGHDLAPDLNSTMLELIRRHCRGQKVPETRRV